MRKRLSTLDAQTGNPIISFPDRSADEAWRSPEMPKLQSVAQALAGELNSSENRYRDAQQEQINARDLAAQIVGDLGDKIVSQQQIQQIVERGRARSVDPAVRQHMADVESREREAFLYRLNATFDEFGQAMSAYVNKLQQMDRMREEAVGSPMEVEPLQQVHHVTNVLVQQRHSTEVNVRNEYNQVTNVFNQLIQILIQGGGMNVQEAEAAREQLARLGPGQRALGGDQAIEGRAAGQALEDQKKRPRKEQQDRPPSGGGGASSSSSAPALGM